MSSVFHEIWVIALLTVAGFAAAKLGIISKELKTGLTNIVIKISVPSAIVASGSLDISGDAWNRVYQVLLITFAYHILTFLFMKYAGSKLFPTPKLAKVATLVVTFSNCMFVGFPVVTELYGKDGLFLASIFCIGFNAIMYTLGVKLLDKEKGGDFKKLLFTPFNAALLIMFFLLITQLKLPSPAQKTLSILGSTSTPLSLLTIGAMIAFANLKEILKNRYLWLLSFLRCLVVPLIMLGVMYFLPWDVVLRKTVVALCAMSSAASNAMLCELYDCEPEFASLSVVQTTIFFALSFPLIMYLTNILIV